MPAANAGWRAYLAAVIVASLATPVLAQPVTTLPNANLPLSGAEILYLIQNGVSDKTTVGNVLSAGSALLFAAPSPIGSTTPNTGVFTTLQATNATTLLGTLTDNTTIDDYAVVPPVYWVMKQATLTPSANTTNVWQNDNSYVYLQGPGRHNGEINLRHTNFNVALGGYATQAEDHEIQMGNSGTIVAWDGDLFLPTNGSTGTVTGGLVDSKYQLTNNNTTAGSIASYAAIDNEAMQGGGSAPAYNYFIRQADPNAVTALSGTVVIGSLSPQGASNLLSVISPGSAGSYYPVSVRNSGGSIFSIQDNGAMVTPTSNKLGAYGSQNYFLLTGQGNGSAPSIQAVGNSDTNIGFNVKTSGTGPLQLNGLAIASSTGVFNGPSASTGSGAQTFTNSPCVGTTTEKWVPITITGNSGTFYFPACQ